MTSKVKNFYWDTCVFIALLNNETESHGSSIASIKQYLSDADSGRCKIYYSTITIAEIVSKRMKTSNSMTFSNFLADLGSAAVPISPDPNIMAVASRLRGMSYAKTGASRPLDTPDAIHLATAINLRDVFGVELDEFHSFDRGRKNGANGKSVPLVGINEWCGECEQEELIKKIVALPPRIPMHPMPALDV